MLSFHKFSICFLSHPIISLKNLENKLSFDKMSLFKIFFVRTRIQIFLWKTAKIILSFHKFSLYFSYQITSHGRKCVVAKAELNPYDKKAEIIRESCNDHSNMIEKSPGPVLTRLFFKNIQKYLCFDRCGRLRTKVIHNSNSVVKILSVTLINQITSKSKILFRFHKNKKYRPQSQSVAVDK